MQRAVFLDRDGVLNEVVTIDGKPYPPKNLNELKLIKGVSKCLKKLKSNGWILIVVTNQPDVSRGITTIEEVEKLNNFLKDKLPIDDFLVCYHDDEDNCSCRKPSPGMLLTASRKFNINLNISYMIGDRWKDIEAGKRAGTKTIFIDYNYTEKKAENSNYVVGSLEDAVSIILN